MSSDPTAVPAAPGPDQRVEISLPDSALPGVYADLVGVWHTNETFVLDFSALVEPPRVADGPGGPAVVQRAQVVSRVRIPPGQVFEIMRALEQQLTAWETESGQRRTPPPA